MSRRLTSNPIIQGDPHLLNQVIENLASNAVKFGETGGVIEMTLRVEGTADAVLGPVLPAGVLQQFRFANTSVAVTGLAMAYISITYNT